MTSRNLPRIDVGRKVPVRPHAAVFSLMCLLCLSSAFADAGASKVLTNHLGYEAAGPKHAVILGTAGDEFSSCALKTYAGDQAVLTVAPKAAGPVQKWRDWHFWTLDFDSVTSEGEYYFDCAGKNGTVRSFPFRVQSLILERNTLSDAIYYFKEERSSGLMDQADRHLHFDGRKQGTLDAHGGWWDATGDYGKHLSHLSFSTYFNPQQISLTAYSLFKTYELLSKRPGTDFRQFDRRILDEAMYGADYLCRMQAKNGAFYRSVGAPG